MTDKLLDKLMKLKANMEGAKEIGNLEEADAFAGFLQKMLYENNMTMTDLEIEERSQTEVGGLVGALPVLASTTFHQLALTPFRHRLAVR